MQPVDYDKVYALWMSCKGMGLNNLDDSKQGIEKFLIRNPHSCFIAEEGDRIIGAIMAGHDGRRGYIYHTAVDPLCRRRGIASKLVSNVMQSFERSGINKVACVAFASNEAGNAFWEKQGFTVREDLVYRNKSLAQMVRTDT